MPESGQAIFVIILTLPGILGFLIFSKIYRNNVEDNIEKISYIVLFNLISIFIFSGFVNISIILKIDYEKIKIENISLFSNKLLAPLSFISMFIAFCLAVALNKGFLQKFLVAKNITPRTEHGSVLSDVICNYPDSFLRFRLKSGGYVVGHVRRWSLNGSENMLFIDKAHRRSAKVLGQASAPKEVSISGPGIMLLSFDDVSYVEVLDGVDL